MAPQEKFDNGHQGGLPVHQQYVAGVAVPHRWGRRFIAGVMALAALSLWSSAAAAVTPCAGSAGVAIVSPNSKYFYLQCYQAIQIPGNPLQTFGGSTFVRTNSTTAAYYLADRSNLGIDVINGQTLKFNTTIKPPASNPFIGQLIWAAG